MSHDIDLVESLYASPNALAGDYSRFRVAERVLLTGHSHQAWPDRGFEGQARAWEDAARLVDDKWPAAFERAERVRRGYGRLLGAPATEVALGASTFELVARFLSALPLRDRPRLVTTDLEFHTLRRLLDRLAEAGVEVVQVAALPADSAAERLAAAVDGRTAAVLASSVYYLHAHIVVGLGRVAEACSAAGAEILVDAYHHLNVVPFSLTAEGLEDAFVTGGGYKYCQLGEGNAFLRVPPGREWRPVLTGWFAEFETLADPGQGRRVAYGTGAAAFAGATYDPTSHYRAAEVFDFFAEHGLEPELLRRVSQHQVGLLAERFDALDADPAVIDRERDVPLEGLGGFLALRSPHAGRLEAELRARGVWADHRGDTLRLGPAPYLADRQLEDGVAALGEVVASLR
jgi:kynureninase